MTVRGYRRQELCNSTAGSSQFREEVLTDLHEGVLGGHLGWTRPWLVYRSVSTGLPFMMSETGVVVVHYVLHART